jgi:dsDNA-binding SOS-regulon protein
MTRKEELAKEEAELYDKINKIRDEKEQLHQQELILKKQEVAKKIQHLRENKDVVLSLVKHSRSSCSDKNVSNGYGSAEYGARCSKCHLIEILDED